MANQMLPSKSEAIRILVAGPSKAANQKIADNILTSVKIEDASSDEFTCQGKLGIQVICITTNPKNKSNFERWTQFCKDVKIHVLIFVTDAGVQQVDDYRIDMFNLLNDKHNIARSLPILFCVNQEDVGDVKLTEEGVKAMFYLNDYCYENLHIKIYSAETDFMETVRSVMRPCDAISVRAGFKFTSDCATTAAATQPAPAAPAGPSAPAGPAAPATADNPASDTSVMSNDPTSTQTNVTFMDQ